MHYKMNKLTGSLRGRGAKKKVARKTSASASRVTSDARRTASARSAATRTSNARRISTARSNATRVSDARRKASQSQVRRAAVVRGTTPTRKKAASRKKVSGLGGPKFRATRKRGR
jgi:hypothetical protein